VDKKRAKSGRESEGISCHKPRGHKNKYLTAHKASDPIESILRKNFAAICEGVFPAHYSSDNPLKFYSIYLPPCPGRGWSAAAVSYLTWNTSDIPLSSGFLHSFTPFWTLHSSCFHAWIAS
jgi:hypothetical protein